MFTKSFYKYVAAMVFCLTSVIKSGIMANMNNKLHEPKFVGDIQNAIGYFVVVTFLTCGVAFVLVGMFAPLLFFWIDSEYNKPGAKEDAKKCEEAVKSNGLKENKGTYDFFLSSRRWAAVILLTLWFVLSWAFFILAQKSAS
jgi:hypothetical protein